MMRSEDREPLLNINPDTKSQWTKVWKGYSNDCERDTDLQSLERYIQTRIKKILNDIKSGDLSIDFFSQVISFVGGLNGKTVEVILGCSQEIKKEKKKKRKQKNEGRYKLVVNEYLNTSSQMLDFCGELDNFLKSACDSHSDIEYVIEQFAKKETDHQSCMQAIVENLKKIQSSDSVKDNSASTKRLLEKIEGLVEQQNKMLNTLAVELEKVGRKHSHARFWRRVANMVLIGTAVSFLVCTVLTAIMVAPPLAMVLVTGLSPAIVTGMHWIVSLLENLEKVFKARKDQINIMQEGALTANKELGDIKFLIGELENQIRSILNTANSEIHKEVDATVKDIKDKLETFLKKINELKVEAHKCRHEILTARDEVERSSKVST